MASTVQDGLLFRSTQALFTAHSVRAIAFDKTGTLSQGVMTVHESSFDQDPLSIQLIHAITTSSKHPVSETAKRYIEVQNHLFDETDPKSTITLREIEEVPGKGVKATFFGFTIMAGSPAFTESLEHPLVKSYLEQGLSILVITLGKQVIGVFGMRDQPRDGVHDLIAHLDRVGTQVALVSGDNHAAVHSFAREVGIPVTMTHAAQTPVSKGQVVQSLKDTHHPRHVAFVGDGINDTIALVTADISIATGSASNASSQIIALSSDIPKAIREILSTSRMSRNHVIVSLAFCGVYFAVAILLASGVTGWRIPPEYAGLGELVSILPVLLVAAHLAAYKSVQRWWTSRKGHVRTWCVRYHQDDPHACCSML
jgi:cation transport ATPase